jgi:hypothetical protein
MPYSIETDNPGCRRGYAVVKDSDREVMGCHATRRAARAQITALNIAEAEQDGTLEDRQEGYAPNDAMVAEARRGLEWRRIYGRGGTEVGIARARDIVNRRNLSRTTVARISSFLARHEVDKQAEGFRPGESGYPSAGRIAWALWGGDPARAWAAAILREFRSLTERYRPPASIVLTTAPSAYEERTSRKGHPPRRAASTRRAQHNSNSTKGSPNS